MLLDLNLSTYQVDDCRMKGTGLLSVSRYGRATENGDINAFVGSSLSVFTTALQPLHILTRRAGSAAAADDEPEERSFASTACSCSETL
jgi:hypothetical protein